MATVLAVSVVVSDEAHLRVFRLGLLLCILLLTVILILWRSEHRRDRREAEHLRQAKVRQDLLLEELNHRVKNTLVTVQSLALQSKQSALKSSQIQQDDSTTAVERFYQAFESRLLALSEAHNLLTQGSWTGVSLHEILRATLQPLTDLSRVSMSGPRVHLLPNVAVTTNLLFHELATNAIKYGALSVPEGRIDISWERRGSSICFEWQECNGPKVSPPEQRGFGSRLIEKAATREIGGTGEMIFKPSGLLCRFEFPLSERVTVSEDSSG